MGALDDLEEAVRRRRDPLSKALVALVPWLGFWVAALSTDRYIDFRHFTSADVRGAVPFTLAMVFLPALMAVCAAPNRVVRHVVTVLVTGVAIFAGVTVVAMDDGQAGFAILWVPLVAAPLAVLVGGASVVQDRRRMSR